MKTSLHALENLIRLLPGKNDPGTKSPNIREITAFLEEAMHEKDRVLKDIVDIGINAGEEKAFQVMIWCYQDCLINLSDKVYAVRQASDPDQKTLFDPLLDALGVLLFFLKENFGPYINQERKIPDVERDRLQGMLGEEWRRLLDKLSGLSGLSGLSELSGFRGMPGEEPGLGGMPGNASPAPGANIVKASSASGDEPYLAILDRWALMVTSAKFSPYLNDRQYTYARILLNELQDRTCDESPLKWNKEHSLFTPLVDVLVYMNFNHPSVAGNIINQWKKPLLMLKSDEPMIVHLQHWRLLLNNMPVQKSFVLYENKPGVRDQLERWLTAQIEGIAFRKKLRPAPHKVETNPSKAATMSMLPLSKGAPAPMPKPTPRTPASAPEPMPSKAAPAPESPPSNAEPISPNPASSSPETVSRPYPLDDGDVGSYVINEAYSSYNASVAISTQIDKMQLNISVPMLALFVRILIEHKIIEVARKTDAIRFFSTHFCTRRQANISTRNLYSCFAKPNPVLPPMLRQYLKGWTRRLERWGKEEDEDLEEGEEGI